MTEDKRNEKRVPVVLRIKLRYQDLGTFIDKFAINLSRGGMFIASRAPKPVGTTIRFELKLADKSTVISGQGVVRWTREYDEENPRALHGMGIAFSQLSDGSETVIAQVVEHRHGLGMTDDLAIPRTVKASGSKPTPEDEQPVARARRPSPAPAPRPPLATEAPTIPDELSRSEDSMSSGPQAEGSSSLSSQAEDSSSSEEELMHFLEGATDAALSRARELARSALGPTDSHDSLDELLKVTATPAAESVTHASQELAAMLGGAPISRPFRSERPGPSRMDADERATLPEPPAFSAEPTLPDISESDEEEEGETVIATQKGARRLIVESGLDDALDALEGPAAPLGVSEDSPVIASAPSEAGLEQALSEIEDSDFGFAAPPMLEETPLPGMTAASVDTSTEATADYEEPDYTYSAPLKAAALTADELLTHVDVFDEDGNPGKGSNEDVNSRLDATLAALEFDDVDVDFDD